MGKMTFAEPFATLEKLIRVTKQGIAEYGFDKFVETTKAQKNECLEILKKSPKGSVSNSSICMKWWRFTYDLKLAFAQNVA